MAETVCYKPTSVEEAAKTLAALGDQAILLAGGTDVMVRVNRGERLPAALVYLGNARLDYIKDNGDSIAIGAATPLADVMKSALVAQELPLLAAVIRAMASEAVRNTGTIGGNLCNASPAADAAVAMLALEAKLAVYSARGERKVDCRAFFAGPRKTTLAADELLREIVIPKNNRLRWGFKKFGKRKADVLSVAAIGIALELEQGRCKNVRVALGAVAPTPVLANKVAAVLENQALNTDLIARAAATVAEDIAPIDDGRSTAWYRKRACVAGVKLLLTQIAQGRS